MAKLTCVAHKLRVIVIEVPDGLIASHRTGDGQRCHSATETRRTEDTLSIGGKKLSVYDVHHGQSEIKELASALQAIDAFTKPERKPRRRPGKVA